MKRNRFDRGLIARTAKDIARRALANDPRSYFYGDAVVDIQPSDVAEAIADPTQSEISEDIIASNAPSAAEGATRIQAFNSLSPDEKAQITLLPPLSVYNAQVIQNPVVGQISAANLNYNLTKNLNEMPFQGNTYSAVATETSGVYTATVTCSVTAPSDTNTYGIPLLTFVISNSTLQTPVGGLVTLRFSGTDVNGNKWSTIESTSQYAYTFQRLVSTEATRGIFIPFQVVATRTLPFMPIFKGGEKAVTAQFQFSGLAAGDTVYVNVLGYASQELKEISQFFNLPAGQLI